MQIPDVIKVPTVGAGGGVISVKLAALSQTLYSVSLADLSLLGSIVVSAVTATWVLCKIYYLVKSKGKVSGD